MFENWKKYLPGNGFWTGRSDLYKDSQRVDYVQNELTTIKGLVPTAQSDAQNKLAALNSTLANTGYAVQTGALDDVYTFIDNMIGQIQTQITNKSDTADEYSKEHSGIGGIFQATLATGGMILSKFGEGVASAFEDVGDAVGTCFGWVEAATDALGITDKGTQFWANVVKTDVSHNIFHSINEGLGLNKHSYLTEDSGLANLSKAAGVATGYLTMSGWLSGAAEGYGNIRNGARFTKFLSSSTNANTIIAGIGGFGSGVENGLQSGQTFARANLTGLAQGGIQAGVAYGMGKLGEGIDKARKVKLAESKYNFMENELAADPTNAAKIAARDLAKSELDALKATKIGWGTNTTFQGYTDPVSLRAREQGKTFGEALARNVTAGGSSGIRALPKAFVQTEGQMIKDAATNAKTAFHDATHNAAGKFSVRTTAGSALRGARDIATAPIRATAGMVKNGVATVGIAPVQTIARDALGIVSATGVNAHNSRITEEFEAGQIFGPTPTIDVTKPPVNPTTAPTATQSPTTSQTPTTSPTTTPTSGPTYDPGPYGPSGPSGPGGPDTPTVTPTAPTTDPITPTVPVTEVPTVSPTTPPTTETIVIETPTSEPPTGGVPWSGDDGHSGGEYSGEDGFISDEEMEPELADLVDDAATSIDEIIKGKKYTKIPTSNAPIARPTTSSGNALIPIAAGLSAAAAAGLGAKAYMDRKNNSDNGEDDIYTDDWSDEDTIDVDYDDASAQEGDLEEEYNYQDVETEKYGARNNEELADLQ